MIQINDPSTVVFLLHLKKWREYSYNNKSNKTQCMSTEKAVIFHFKQDLFQEHSFCIDFTFMHTQSFLLINTNIYVFWKSYLWWGGHGALSIKVRALRALIDLDGPDQAHLSPPPTLWHSSTLQLRALSELCHMSCWSPATAMPVATDPTGWDPELQNDFLAWPHSCCVTVNVPSHQWLYLTLIMATRSHPDSDPHPHSVPDQASDFSSLTLDLPQICLMSWTPGDHSCHLWACPAPSLGLCYQGEILALTEQPVLAMPWQSSPCHFVWVHPEWWQWFTISGILYILSWENFMANLSCTTLL